MKREDAHNEFLVYENEVGKDCIVKGFLKGH